MKETRTYDEDLGSQEFPNFRSENPFTVPANYFEESASYLLSITKLEPILSKASENPFGVPSGYFDELHEQVINRVKLAQVLPNDQADGFSVPENYFDNSAEQIVQLAKLSNRFGDAKDTEDNGFSVTPNYFETLSARISEKIKEEDLIGENQQEKQPTKVVYLSRWTRYVAAACILFVLSIAAYIGSNNGERALPQQAIAETSLDAVSDEELVAYLASSQDDNDLAYFAEYCCDEDEHEHADEKKCSKLEDKELEAYINHML